MAIIKNEDGTYSKTKEVEAETETFTREQKLANLEVLKKNYKEYAKQIAEEEAEIAEMDDLDVAEESVKAAEEAEALPEA